jgi:hypothetical protein
MEIELEEIEIRPILGKVPITFRYRSRFPFTKLIRERKVFCVAFPSRGAARGYRAYIEIMGWRIGQRVKVMQRGQILCVSHREEGTS